MPSRRRATPRHHAQRRQCTCCSRLPKMYGIHSRNFLLITLQRGMSLASSRLHSQSWLGVAGGVNIVLLCLLELSSKHLWDHVPLRGCGMCSKPLYFIYSCHILCSTTWVSNKTQALIHRISEPSLLSMKVCVTMCHASLKMPTTMTCHSLITTPAVVWWHVYHVVLSPVGFISNIAPEFQ